MADIGLSPLVISCPSCPKCGTRMLLIRIFPDRPGYDQRTYECPRCEHAINAVVACHPPNAYFERLQLSAFADEAP